MIPRPSKASKFRNRIPCCLKSMKGLASSRRGNWCDCPQNHAPLAGFCTSVGYVLIALHVLTVEGCYDRTALQAICAPFRCNRLVRSETLLGSFTQARGIGAGFLKGPMSAMSENALSLWTLPIILGIRTSILRRGLWSLRQVDTK